MNDLLELIRKERERQDEKWGTQDVPDPVMYVVLGEEVGEVGKAILEGDEEGIKSELIQVAAVAIKMLQFINSRGLRRK
jgi:NTP pyrophosphatase (non-canonical NTP hydrolase)